jgi:hypothetical protein
MRMLTAEEHSSACENHRIGEIWSEIVVLDPDE